MDQLQQLSRLLQYCEAFARRRLADTGRFLPFGAFINSAGQLEALAAAPPKAGSSSEAYEMLLGLAIQLVHEGRARSYAIASDVNIPERLNPQFPDGLRIEVEAEGYARTLYTPYRILPMRALRRFFVVVPAVEYGDEIRVDARQKAFPDASVSRS